MAMVAQELDPTREIVPDETVSFDVFDPIDAQLVDYQAATMADQLPTGAQQEKLVRGVQQTDESSARSLIRSHKGLVAAVAYGYKGQGLESHELMITGVRALVSAAGSYNYSDIAHFSDRAVLTIDAALAAAVPDGEGRKDFSDPSEGRPMEQVYKLMAALRPAAEREARNQKALAGFTPMEQKVLRLLTLPTHQQIADKLGPPVTWAMVNNTISRNCFSKTGTNNSTSLALEMYSRGLHYDVPVPENPLVETLSDDELEIGNLLGLEYEEIGNLVGGKTTERIKSMVYEMRQKTGTRSREELAVMIAMYDTGERRSPDSILSSNLKMLSAKLGAVSLQKGEVELLLEGLTDSQRDAIDTKWLSGKDTSWKEAGDELGVDPEVARLRAKAGIQAMRKLYASKV